MMRWSRWIVAVGMGVLPALAQTVIEPRIVSETLPSGGLMQIKLDFTSPHPITTGGTGFDMDAAFESVEGVSIFSPAGDAYGIAIVQNGRFRGNFVSPLASLGTQLDYPYLVVASKIRSGLTPGAQIPINFNGVTFFGPGGAPYSIPAPKNGVLTIGGTVSVTNVIPGGGPLPAGFTVRLLGTGFNADTKVTVNEVAISNETLVSPTEITFTLDRATDLTEKLIRVRNKDNSEAAYYSYLRANPMGSSSQPLLNVAHPVFADLSVTGAGIAVGTPPPGGFIAFALQNSRLQSTTVELELISAAGLSLGKTNLNMPAAGRYIRSVQELFSTAPAGSKVRIVSGAPIQILGIVADDSAGTATAFPAAELPPAPAPQLFFQPAALAFNFQIGGALPSSQTLNVTSTGSPLTFTAAGNTSWLTAAPANGQTPLGVNISINPAGLSPGVYNGIVTLTPPAGSAPQTIPVTLTVTAAVVPCAAAPAASDLTKALPAIGGTAAIQMIAGVGCPWTAQSNATWLTVDSGTSGNGNGVITIRAQQNDSSTARTAQLQAGTGTVQVNQPGTLCSYSLSQATANYAFGGGTGSAQITVTPASCAWSVTTDVPWITLGAPLAGNGNATINYTVAPAGSARQGNIAVGGLTLLVTQSSQPPPPVTALRFVPILPCRAADTRLPGKGAPSLNAATSRDFDLRGSGCGLPTSAAAYSLNITAVPKSTTLSFLTAWPAGQTRPLASTLNAWDGRVVANAAIIPAGVNGGLSVFVSDAADVIVDVNGYFVPPTEPNALAFYPLPPCRVYDTRLTQNKLSAAQPRDFDLLGSACGIPAAARAYSLNLTTIPETTLAFLSAWPAGQSQPTVSTLNAFNGQITANAAIVPAGAAGKISLFASNNSDVIIDINGYFAPPATGGLSYVPVTPCRIADTRAGAGFTGNFGGPALLTGNPRTFPVPSSACTIPSAGAYAINYTAVPPGPLAFLSTGPAGAPQPPVSTLNSFNGQVVANLAIVPSGTAGAITTWVSGLTDLVLDITGYFQP